MNRIISKIQRFLLSTPGLIFAGTVAVCLAAWFFGPLLVIGDWAPLESETNRIIFIAGFVGLILLILLIRWLLRLRRERKMTEDLAKGGEEQVDPTDAAAKAELTELQGRMKESLSLLRKAKLGGKGGGQYLYQLPWYLMIGPPGSGKTTAIVNSGLKFPLADKMGKAAVVGVGGTRNCDWWFTNDAVLIDTAGRYTTQESDAEVDARSWLGFLDILKKYRKRQPVNGAIVAISLSDLSLQDEVARRTHALAIRTRLRELREKLGVRFPVYVLFTKADLIAGFAEFYDRLGKQDREQVWGATFPVDKAANDTSPLARFDVEFDGLVQRLNDRTVELLQQEVDHRRRSLIYGFPAQVESLRVVAREFLGEIFQDSRFEDRQFLRGFYFTSGTQEGTPIDRLMRGMAQTFGIGRQAVGTGQGQGKSFFLTRLLDDVIFGEAGLVSADDAVERRYRWILRGSIAAGILVFAGFAGMWTRSYLGNAELVSQAQARVAEYQEAVRGVQVSPVEDIDVASVVPGLNILRDMPGNPTVNDPEPPTRLTWGLYQGDSIGTEAAQTYRRALNQLLLPRLLLRLEKQMQASMNDADLLYPALKVYLMLGLQGPMDEDLVRQWMNVDWGIAYGGSSYETLRRDLSVHLDALLSQPMTQVELNGPLVEQIQGLLSESPLAERIYQSIVESAAAREIPVWRILDAGGPATSRVLVRPSGEPLSEGVEGIYTYDGFTQVFLPEALEVADRMARESWVLGPRGATELNEAALGRLTRDILNLYYSDYIARWDKILGDLDIVPMESVSHAVEVTNIISGPSSPIVNILRAVSEETKLTRPPGGDLVAAVDEETTGAVTDILTKNIRARFDQTTRELTEALQRAQPGGSSGTVTAEDKFGQYVEDRFAWLHTLVGAGDGTPSPLDNVIQSMTAVYQELNRMTLQPGSLQLGPAGEAGAAARLQQEATRLEGPVQRWALQVAQGSSGITAGGTRAALNQKWQAQVLPLCERTLEGRYPFDPKAQADVALQDFARLFAPGGLIDAFFNENLVSYVETSAKPWRWRRVNNADLGISAAVLTQFQNAADIRDSFFLSGGPPSVTFDLKPVALTPNATSVMLEVEGQTLEYAHGPQQITPMKWPGQGSLARVSFTPQEAGIENSMKIEGPWAWFRLLDAAEVRRTNVSDRSRVVFNVGGRIAVFELRAGSALNPFSLPALQAFRCVKSL